MEVECKTNRGRARPLHLFSINWSSDGRNHSVRGEGIRD